MGFEYFFDFFFV